MTMHARDNDDIDAWMRTPRFAEIARLHTADQVVEQQGTIAPDYAVARRAAEAFYDRLRALFEKRQAITTFGPYSPGQAVVMKRRGIEGIYLGGWATSAKGGASEDPGADLASYPLSQVPDEAAAIVRALLAADRNQEFARLRMTAEQRRRTPAIDFRPFIIADADTGHGGDAHVRNLIRRFVEAGVPGYHIEDQKPGVKKCGHQGGKVLVAQAEQIQRLNAARLQLDVMRVPGLIVARTDAEAATLLDNSVDERDHPFILGVTNTAVPSYRAVVITAHRLASDMGVGALRGHHAFALSAREYEQSRQWLESSGLTRVLNQLPLAVRSDVQHVDDALDAALQQVLERWQTDAGLQTYREAVANAMRAVIATGTPAAMSLDEWQARSRQMSLQTVRDHVHGMGLRVSWDCERARTTEGYYQVTGGIEFAVARSLAAAPFADVLWMETKTADLEEAKAYADAIHARYPAKMLAYNLSPSFNWDTTGMTDAEMESFPGRLAELGFVFNFITYGGHQIDGLAAEEFATALRDRGMLALAHLQRRIRVMDSPYRTPQSLVGGARLDAALMAASGRMATTKAMGPGSTQHQHLKETEYSTRHLEGWLEQLTASAAAPDALKVRLTPVPASSWHELRLVDHGGATRAVVSFSSMDLPGGQALWLRDATAADPSRDAAALTMSAAFLLRRHRATRLVTLDAAPVTRSAVQGLRHCGLLDDVKGFPVETIARVNLTAVDALSRETWTAFASVDSKGGREV